MTRKLGKKGLALIKSFESFVPYVYDDMAPISAGRYREWKKGQPVKGTLTIGYGHTDGAKYKLGFKLKDTPAGYRLSEKEASIILDVDLDECEDAVNSLVKVDISQGQFDALTSFAFNCGVGNLKKLVVPLNAGSPSACRRKFDEFVRSKGVVLRGLVRRRDAEQALFDDRYEDVVLPEEPVIHGEQVDEPAEAPKQGITEGAQIGAGMTVAGIFASIWEKFNEASASVQDAVISAATKPSFWAFAGVGVILAYVWYRRAKMKAVTQ